MDIEITEKKENPLLDRMDVRFVIQHEGEKTPTREQVRKALASALGKKAELTVIDNMESHFGRGSTKGFAKVYVDVEKARYHERDYILKRNGLFVEAKKKEEAA